MKTCQATQIGKEGGKDNRLPEASVVQWRNRAWLENFIYTCAFHIKNYALVKKEKKRNKFWTMRIRLEENLKLSEFSTLNEI